MTSRFLALVILAVGISGCSVPAPALDNKAGNAKAAVDRGPVVDSIVAKFGEPDLDDSTAYDNPRPPMVSRFLIYKKERVKFFLMPEAGVSDPPPYKGWRLIAMLDADNGEPLKADTVRQRMGKRMRTLELADQLEKLATSKGLRRTRRANGARRSGDLSN